MGEIRLSVKKNNTVKPPKIELYFSDICGISF